MKFLPLVAKDSSDYSPGAKASLTHQILPLDAVRLDSGPVPGSCDEMSCFMAERLFKHVA
jgi:hypothetical protein